MNTNTRYVLMYFIYLTIFWLFKIQMSFIRIVIVWLVSTCNIELFSTISMCKIKKTNKIIFSLWKKSFKFEGVQNQDYSCQWLPISVQCVWIVWASRLELSWLINIFHSKKANFSNFWQFFHDINTFFILVWIL